MHTVVLVLHVLAAISITALVLMQHGKGADMGAAFGSGSAGSLFGSAGAANFLSRSTAVLAAVFFATSLGLTYFSGVPGKSGGVTQSIGGEVPKAPEALKTDVKPAAPASSAPASPAPADSKSTDIPK
ncbi:preprotein translocase subunit SecG [Usitatibacter palustris]|uniref:Protein-export membrane protein SecG n=1 Tax=Usitatibacter palustris TaxID=2732487 RepID=A0A6M4H925_9PROT|nr:preprotein translocase subunit SecG [Usitatibacter palustris]QJR16086.1 Protein-export membrane protein SecG [Usitatibacter palustris]